MLISEAFDLYKNDYMSFKLQSQRIFETHELVKRTMIDTVGNKNISELGLSDIAKWKSQMLKRKGQNAFRNDIIRLRMVLKYLELREIKCLKSNLVPVPKRIETVPTFLKPEEIDLMLANTARLRNRFIISLLYSSGIRLSELLHLNRNEINDRRFTVVGKGGKARLCFIDERTERYMQEYLKSREDGCNALVISYTNQERMTATNVQLLVKNAAKRAGISKHVTPHTLRHSFATNFLQNNGNLRYCQEMMGHASIETTMHYSHVTNTDLEDQYRKYHTF